MLDLEEVAPESSDNYYPFLDQQLILKKKTTAKHLLLINRGKEFRRQGKQGKKKRATKLPSSLVAGFFNKLRSSLRYF